MVFRVLFPEVFLFPTGFCLDSPGPLDSKEKYVFTGFKSLYLGKTPLTNVLLKFFVLWMRDLDLAAPSKTCGSCK